MLPCKTNVEVDTHLGAYLDSVSNFGSEFSAKTRPSALKRVGFGEALSAIENNHRLGALLQALRVDLDEIRAEDFVEYAQTKALIDCLPSSSAKSAKLPPSEKKDGPKRTFGSGSPSKREHWSTHKQWQLYLHHAQEEKETLFPSIERVARSREEVLELSRDHFGCEARCIPSLYLQVHSFMRDRNALPTVKEYEENQRLRAHFQSYQTIGENEDESETRSAVSSVTSKSTRSARIRNKAKANVAASTEDDYWISLKGIVFQINLNTESRGRNLYYSTSLVPIFSGRDCTAHFANLVSTRPGEELSIPCGELFMSPTQKAHIDKIMDMFVRDFSVVGYLEGGETLWN